MAEVRAEEDWKKRVQNFHLNISNILTVTTGASGGLELYIYSAFGGLELLGVTWFSTLKTSKLSTLKQFGKGVKSRGPISAVWLQSLRGKRGEMTVG